MISNLSRPAKLHVLSLVLLTSGAVAAQKTEPSPHQTGIPGEVYVIGEAMDRLARQAEEWGTMQMSAPLLVEPLTNFNFNLQRGTSTYFSEAKNDIQIATAYSDQSFQSLNVALQVQNDPTVAAAFTENLRQYQTQTRRAEDTQFMLQQLDHLQFTDGLDAALAETNAAVRQAM